MCGRKGSAKSEQRGSRTNLTYLTFAKEAGRAKVMAPPNRAWERTAVGGEVFAEMRLGAVGTNQNKMNVPSSAPAMAAISS